MVLSYKCPGCGAVMAFNEEAQKLVCPQCGRQEKVSDMSREYAAEEPSAAHRIEEMPESQQEISGYDETAVVDNGTMELTSYKCTSCGADLLTDEVTVATFCSYCGNSTLIPERVNGQKRPSRVIPFMVNKENAVEAFRRWTHKGLLTPGAFRSQTFLDKISGIYVPFWLYDMDADVDFWGDGQRVRSETRGGYRYTHTDHFDVRRQVHAHYRMVPADASARMDDHMMDCLEPFQYSALTGFQMPYLSGFYAEKNSYTAKDISERVERRVKQFGLDETMETIQGYSTVVPKRRYVQPKVTRVEYVLLPVWLLNYTYRGKQYTFALNGQTGKMVGTLPVSKGKAAALFSAVFAVVFTVMMLIG